MSEELLEALIDEKAVDLAVLLNSVGDDDERERLEQLFERRLNAELFHGSEMRQVFSSDGVMPHLSALRDRIRGGCW